MKSLRWIAPLMVVLFGMGVVLLDRNGQEPRTGADGALEKGASSGSRISAKPARAIRVPEKRERSSEAHSFGDLEGRTWTVAEANPAVLDEMLLQKSMVASGDSGPLGTPREAGISAAAESTRSTDGAAGMAGLSAQVLAHRRGRFEFMRQRQEELASHQPGCKCAYHLGHE